eukprot:SAG31_NODE_6779_length_1892_cov_1.511991_3_plen_383_part_00
MAIKALTVSHGSGTRSFEELRLVDLPTCAAVAEQHPFGPTEAKLLQVLVDDLAQVGGAAFLSELAAQRPQIRRLLGERKLSFFSLQHRECRDVLRLLIEKEESATKPSLSIRSAQPPLLLQLRNPSQQAEVPPPAASAPRSGNRVACAGCGQQFLSRNALFKLHLRSGNCPASTKSIDDTGCPASTKTGSPTNILDGGPTSSRNSQAESFLVNAVINEISRRDSKTQHRLNAEPANNVPIAWTVQPPKPQSALRRYLKDTGILRCAAASGAGGESGLELVTGFQSWWVTGLKALYSLLVARPETFVLSETGAELGIDVLKRTRVRLTKNAIATTVEASSIKTGSEVPEGAPVVRRGACAVQPKPTILLVCPGTCVIMIHNDT